MSVIRLSERGKDFARYRAETLQRPGCSCADTPGEIMSAILTRPFVRVAFIAALLAASTGVSAQSARLPEAAPPALPRMSAVQPPKAAPDMQAVLVSLAALGGKPIETLTPAEARMQPSAADGAKATMAKKGMSTTPDASVVTQDIPYGADTKQFARIYKPAAARAGGAMMPIVVYYHGGGWVIADVDTYDAAPRAMAKALNAIVVSVEYRRAPEFKFPAQHEDAAAAYRWTLQNAAKWGGDPAEIAVAGESAGGNLAVATAIYARDNGLTVPRHIVSVYPIANSSMTLPSRKDSANAKPLNGAMLKWFGYYYQSSTADAQDPRLNLVAANLHGLPPTTIINAQIDPLRSDGETLAAAMRNAGVTVEQKTFPGVTHEFFGMAAVVHGAKEANDLAVARLKAAFASAPARR
ncbi:MAG: alpha/beta hydrolase [Janthinobacterium lividum]